MTQRRKLLHATLLLAGPNLYEPEAHVTLALFCVQESDLKFLAAQELAELDQLQRELADVEKRRQQIAADRAKVCLSKLAAP